MSAAGPRLPASEVARYFLSIFARLGIGVLVGLAVAKGLVTAEVAQKDAATMTGYLVIGAVLIASFLIKPLRSPEIEYPEGSRPNEGESLIAFLYEDDPDRKDAP